MTIHFTQKYLEAFVYSGFFPTDQSSQFLYMYETKGKKFLHRFDSNKHKSLSEGERIIDIDFNKQACWPIRMIDNSLYLISDVDNQENTNINVIDLIRGTITKLTENEYTSCVRVTDDEIGYFCARSKNNRGLFENQVHIKNFKTGEDKVVIDDQGDEYRVAWGQIFPSKNGEFLILNVDKNNERTNLNLCLVNIANKSKRNLLPKEIEASRIYLVDDLVNTDKGFYFVSNISGFDNLYYFNFTDQSCKKLSDVKYITEGFHYLVSQGQRYFYYTEFVATKGKTEVFFLKEESAGNVSKVENTLSFEGEISTFTQNKDFLWIASSHVTKTPERILYKFNGPEIERVLSIPFLKESTDCLIHSTHEYSTYQSFDGLEIPTYIVIPKGEIKGAVITAFYGGGNYFSTIYQIMAELGFVSLSPAVRGSWGHGKDWEDKIKGDLGGSEILDVLWGAKFLEKKFGLNPSQIGVEGGSHGGYSTLRALTLPDNFKGQDSKYPFGFGICWAGFADLVDFYKNSNIPDWLANMLGPYEENKELYKERAPLTHFEELNAPLFITHGTKDSRVPPSTMEGFLRKLRDSDKPHYIYLMEGQGHTGGSVEERVDEYTKMFKFLNEATPLDWTK